MSKRWTEQEEKYIEKKYLAQPISVTAKRLNRTIPSVKAKAARLGLNRHIDILSASALAECFHVEVIAVIRWIDKLEMPCKITRDKNRRYFDIDLEEFWTWAENHKSDINWARYEKGSLALEPSWVKEEQEKDLDKKSRMKWTSMEEAILQHMLRKGLSYTEISYELQRSYSSIRHHVKVLYDRKCSSKQKASA